MAPPKAPSSGSEVRKRAGKDDAPVSNTAKKKKEQKQNKDDLDLLEGYENTRWTDTFVVLRIVRALVETSMEKYKSLTQEKKEEKKVFVLDKEFLIEATKPYRLPLALLVLFILMCMFIAAGEDFGEQMNRDDRNKVEDDLYRTLGVQRDAREPEIKQAYKTLARKWHPDKNPNCKECQDKFAKIGIAYETLSDEKKRSMYDETGGVGQKELKSKKSIPLNQENFRQLVLYSNDVWLVQIFKPEDGSCQSFHPFWEHQIQKYGNLVRFGRVDVTNDIAKWLPVKYRMLPTVLKFGRHLSQPEIFPITATHETPQVLTRFVLTSFPNVGLPLGQNKDGVTRWVNSATRLHKILFAIPGKSEDERYKSHLIPRKLAAQWSDLFDFRIAEPKELHKLTNKYTPDSILQAIPGTTETNSHASVILFPAAGGSDPIAVRKIKWPCDEDELVLQLLDLAPLAAPILTARSAELLCRSTDYRRVYCLVLVDEPDPAFAIKALKEIQESRKEYMVEVEDLRKRKSEEGGEDIELSDDEEFIVLPVRLLLGAQGLQPSVATCRTPRWAQVDSVIGDASAFLMDFSELEAGRIAPLKKDLKSFKNIYPMIAYEDDVKWTEDALHPFLSLPDCDESMLEHSRRAMRSASFGELLLHGLTVLFLLEATLKAIVSMSWQWAVGAVVLLGMMLLQSTPFLRFLSTLAPAAIVSPQLPPM